MNFDAAHITFLERAIAIAIECVDANIGGPFGCVIVKNGEIIAEGTNEVTSTNDPTAHAEVVAIRLACKKLNDFQLTDCTIYASCEPCPMCLGAIYWARPSRVVFAATRQEAAAIGFDDQFIYDELEKPMAERKIPFQHLPLPKADALFEAWQAKEDKMEY
jgi:tRNA(Arg) A34 adenosine deaminase TadA